MEITILLTISKIIYIFPILEVIFLDFKDFLLLH